MRESNSWTELPRASKHGLELLAPWFRLTVARLGVGGKPAADGIFPECWGPHDGAPGWASSLLSDDHTTLSAAP